MTGPERGADAPPLAGQDLEVRLGGATVLRGVTLTLARGAVTGVVGPNGSGKTTLLRALFRGVRVSGGTVRVDGTTAADLSGRELARRVAAAVQEPGHPGGLSVREVVDVGRFPHRGDLARPSAADDAAVLAAAAATGVTHLLERDLAHLSGGERQRVHVARAIAQECGVLLLDEPTNHLDVAHQFSLLTTLRRLAADGTAVALAVHDLGLAARYCDQVVVMAAGRVVAAGAPYDVLTDALTREVFGVRSHLDAQGRLVLDPLEG